MQWFHNLRLRAKLIVGFSSVVAILLVVGVTSVVSIRALDRADTELYENMTLPLAQSGEAMTLLQRVRVNLREAVIAESPEAAAPFITKAEQFTPIVDSLLKQYEGSLTTEAGRALFADFSADLERFNAARATLVGMIRAGDRLGTYNFMTGDLVKSEEQLLVSMTKLQQQKIDRAGEVSAANTALATRVTWTVSILLALGVVLSIAIALFISGRLSNLTKLMAERVEMLQNVCITNIGTALDALADGQLDVRPAHGTQPIQLDSRDELGDLARSINGIIAKSVASIHAYGRAADAMQALVRDAHRLVESARAGVLDQRADATGYRGGYRELVEGMNGLVDAVAAPIDESATVLGRVAHRDLTVEMQGEYRGEFERIKRSINEAIQNLRVALSDVSASASQVATASEEISSGSQSLAEGAGEQASSLEEVAASLHEVAATAKQSAQHAQGARAVSEQARVQANEGLNEMKELAAAMHRIKASADQSAKIVKTIDEIAFQTNLLALNAAVEAARAGDAGRGFAVVAEEVRNLAMRAAEAARTTTDLIAESVKNSDDGVARNARAVEQLASIAQRVESAGQAMSEIAAGSDEQALGIEQISIAVEQINVVTQRVAANAEESSATSTELAGQASHLQQLVSEFRLSAGRRESSHEAGRSALEPVTAASRGGKRSLVRA